MKQIKRIRIIGGPGSGKTTLAKKLANKINCQHYDMDDWYFKKEAMDYKTKHDQKTKKKLMTETTKKQQWIIEGAFTSKWYEQTWKKADLIIILNPPTWVRTYRIIKRWIQRKYSKKPQKKETIIDIYNLLKFNHRYNTYDLPKLHKELQPHNNKVRVTNKRTPTLQDVL